MNASWDGSGITLNLQVNIALAMALDPQVDTAVVTGVIHDADTRSIGEIAVRRRELAARARAGRLQPADIAGGTFTISNLGMYDVEHFSAIINPPQAAILAVGAALPEVVPWNGQPAVRRTMRMTLSVDHRALDGASGAKFLKAIKDLLEAPSRLVIQTESW